MSKSPVYTKIKARTMLNMYKEPPHKDFTKYIESINDENDKKRFQRLWMPFNLIANNKKRSELLGEG